MGEALVESVIESFPDLIITRVEGEPTFKTIKEVEKCIITNASSIESELGGGPTWITRPCYITKI